MVLIHRPLGTYHPYLVPEKAGPDYVAPRYLKQLETHRKHRLANLALDRLGAVEQHEAQHDHRIGGQEQTARLQGGALGEKAADQGAVERQ